MAGLEEFEAAEFDVWNIATGQLDFELAGMVRSAHQYNLFTQFPDWLFVIPVLFAVGTVAALPEPEVSRPARVEALEPLRA